MSKVKRAVIIAGGSIEDYSWYQNLWQENDYLICADSGVNHASQLEIIPDLIVGDLDSAYPESIIHFQKLGCQVVEYNREKDQTDTQIALEYALKKKPKEILILGALGDRIDHTMANIFLLSSLMKSGIRVSILNEKQEVSLIEGKAICQGKTGDLISLLPLTPWVKGIKTQGLKYPVKGGIFRQSNPYGVSNELIEQEAIIEIEEGILILVRVFNN